LALGIEEKYDQVRQLITMGKERGYLLYDEVNDILPAEVHSSEEIDDLLSTFERYGIDVYEDVNSAKAARAAAEAAEAVEKGDAAPEENEVELDLTPGTLEKTNDPVRMYLREMGTVPLLTREGEVAIAKRIERGQNLVLKTISRSPIVLKELLAAGEDLRQGARSIKEIVQFDDEELTEEKIEKKTKDTLRLLDKIGRLYIQALKQAEKLDRTLKSKKKVYLRGKYALARTRIEMSNMLRSLDFNPFERKRLIETIRQTVERVHTLERESVKLERRVDASKGDVLAEARRSATPRRSLWERYQWAAGLAAAASLVLIAGVLLPQLTGGSSDDGTGALRAPTAESGGASDATLGASEEAVQVEILGRDLDDRDVKSLAKEAAQVAPAAPERDVTASFAEPGDAISCLVASGATIDDRDVLVRVIQATYLGTPAYLGVLHEGPGGGLPPQRIVVWVVSSADCAILTLASQNV